MPKKEESARLKSLWVAKAGILGLTYSTAATKMGFKKGAISSVSHMLNGINEINLKHGLEFCEILQIELSDFSTRLHDEAVNIATQISYKGNGIAQDVNWIVGISTMTIKEMIAAGERAEKKVYWPGEHSENTYAIEVRSEANSPRLNSGSTAIVDFDKEPIAGQMICLWRDSNPESLGFAELMGDGYAKILNENFPDRVFKLDTCETELIGSVIGKMDKNI
tara:strand:- start:140 stop:805 length:666 start_codon:yes stop_codon:yes gene_type:complete